MNFPEPRSVRSLYDAPFLERSADISTFVSMTILGFIVVLYTIPLFLSRGLLKFIQPGISHNISSVREVAGLEQRVPSNWSTLSFTFLCSRCDNPDIWAEGPKGLQPRTLCYMKMGPLDSFSKLQVSFFQQYGIRPQLLLSWNIDLNIMKLLKSIF